MKTKLIFAVLTILSMGLFVSISRAADITAAQSGNWGDPNTWIGGVVPGTNDSADIEAPNNVTVNTNASAQVIYGSGKVTMAANSTLTILGNYATYQLATLDTSATGNTVVYAGNPFYAKQCNYYNLVFANTNFVPSPPFTLYQDFNNFSGAGGPTPMTIAGNMTVIGYTKVQQGSGGGPITIDGNLVIGTNCIWDSSGDDLTVVGNTTIGGLLEDLNGALGNNLFDGDITINPGGHWNLGDVVTWFISGNLTNNGIISGAGYGSINFYGTGNIAGSKPITIPTLEVDGAYTVGTTITLTTNTPTLYGTLVFDIAHPGQIILGPGAGTPLYYAGSLEVVNSGAPPASGASFTLFQCVNGFGGFFDSTTFPGLPAGLSWVDNTITSGSIAVTGTALGLPTLTLTKSGSVLTLSWNSTTFPGYRVLAQTNTTGLGGNWSSTGSGTTSPFITTVNPANRAVFYRLSNP